VNLLPALKSLILLDFIVLLITKGTADGNLHTQFDGKLLRTGAC
jgi:hypothetical protein